MGRMQIKCRASFNHEKRNRIKLLKVTLNTAFFNTAHSNQMTPQNFLSLRGPLVSSALYARTTKQLSNRKERLKVSLGSLYDHSAKYTVSHA
jgi:hypothetical protein